MKRLIILNIFIVLLLLRFPSNAIGGGFWEEKSPSPTKRTEVAVASNKGKNLCNRWF